jgi:hypothetical protein
MLTLTTTALTIIPTHDMASAPLAPIATERPVVRVLWGRALGSTYQRYLTTLSPFESARGGSMFSNSLTCPSCGGAFDLHQPMGSSPDHLIGKCAGCRTSSHLEVGDEGRLTFQPSR